MTHDEAALLAVADDVGVFSHDERMRVDMYPLRTIRGCNEVAQDRTGTVAGDHQALAPIREHPTVIQLQFTAQVRADACTPVVSYRSVASNDRRRPKTRVGRRLIREARLILVAAQGRSDARPSALRSRRRGGKQRRRCSREAGRLGL